MSSRPALIRERDVTRILRGAAKAGITLGIVVRGEEVHFKPVDGTENSEGLSALEKWKADRYGLRANGHS